MWFRRDLRLADNAALAAALASADAVVPVFVVPIEGPHAPGVASRDWLAGSLAALDGELNARGAELVVRSGSAADAIAAIAREVSASTVHCQRDWTPMAMAEESSVRQALGEHGIGLRVAEGQLLVNPEELRTGEGGPYRVFTPFYRAWRQRWESKRPHEAPPRIPTLAVLPASESRPSDTAAKSLTASGWEFGEAAAQCRLAEFVGNGLEHYSDDRDLPALHGTSELSPRLAWGELSARQVALRALEGAGELAEPFVRQLAWREFAYHVLHHFPHTAEQPLRPEFSAFPWCDDQAGFEAWTSGHTGYPIVDAGMRQLAATGWMHNRVRLVCGSFLTKDLLIPWQMGEAYFREALCDYDPAANAFNWQWVAGSGADAAPYFRIFNPTIQGKRFDPDGAYVRAWVPELVRVPSRWIHNPWEAPTGVLRDAEVVIGETYPDRVIDHSEARNRALAAFAALRDAPPPLV